MKDVLQKSAGNYKPRGHLDPAGFKHHLDFQTYLPPDGLVPFVEHFWIIRWEKVSVPYKSEQVMHRPYVDIFVSAVQSGIQGTFRGKRTYVATVGSGRIIGIRFRPGAFHEFWAGKLGDLQERIVGLQQVFPEADSAFIQHLLTLDDQAVIHNLIKQIRARHPRPDSNIKLINDIIAAIETNESLSTVSSVAKVYGKSERWLQQLFQDYIGVGLKWLLQRHKLLAAAEQIRKSDQPAWAMIAYDLGYSSQQHFNTDFKQVLGKTPGQYKKELTTP